MIGCAVCEWLVDNKLLGKIRVDSRCLRLEGVARTYDRSVMIGVVPEHHEWLLKQIVTTCL